MGRITVFTADDVLSKRVKHVLEENQLPYTEISLVQYPCKLLDLQNSISRVSVPQVFFNTRYVGGLDATLRELRRWKRIIKNGSILTKYKKEIASVPLDNSKFELPARRPHPPVNYVPSRQTPIFIELPDGTKTTLGDITEKLRNSLPCDEIKRNDAIYFKCFTATSAVHTFVSSLGIKENEAVAFGQRLQEAGVLYRIGPKNGFEHSDDCVCRLSCDRHPDILNSYCEWRDRCEESCTRLVEKLDILLKEIEFDCIDADLGKVNYRAVSQHDRFPHFEEAVCELQKADIKRLSRDEMLAFALNLFQLMAKYAHVKLGTPTNEHNRLSMLTDIKFNVGGYVFSFQEWIDGVLRGNSRARFSKKVAFSLTDSRRQFAIKQPDSRIHFVVNHAACFGSRVSFPFTRFTAKQLDEQLELAARTFFEDDANFTVKAKAGRVELSKPLMWYRSDFTRTDHKMIGMMKRYINGIKSLKLKKLVQTHGENFKIEYLDPDYERNACNAIEFDQVKLDDKVKGMRVMFRRFRSARFLQNELSRLSTLHGLKILDTLPEERFDRITKMVQNTFDVPLVLVSLVDQNRLWLKSTQWSCTDLSIGQEAGRDDSFCGHAIQGSKEDILCVLDATKDDRFADNPAVTGQMSVRFYAGCPLTIPSVENDNMMVNIGTLCVVDRKPRETFSVDEEQQLRKYTRMVRDEILRRDEEESSCSS